MYILGISGGLDHDASACLLKDGRIVAMAEEERFIRQKFAWNEAAVHSAAYCLKEANITPRDVDYLALGWIPIEDSTWPTMISAYKDLVEHPYFAGFSSTKVEHVPHHVAHAAAAYYTSGFDQASILVVDGQGEYEATTFAHGKGNDITILRNYDVSHSLGSFYTALTNYLGYFDGQEGKVMGLAAYGNPRFSFPQIRETIDGYTVDIPDCSDEPPGIRFSKVKQHWINWLEAEYGKRRPFQYHLSSLHNSNDLQATPESLFCDIAASGQAQLESVVCHLVSTLIEETACGNVVIGGGVGLNCSLNGKLGQLPGVDNLYLFPASGDAGTSAGAALALYYKLYPADRVNDSLESAALGPSFSNYDIGPMLSKFGLKARLSSDICKDTAELIAQGRVLGWFNGRMEVGPRALGNRSILACPADQEMRERVNILKGRELWRPLAGSFLSEKVGEYFCDTSPHSFMLKTASIRESTRASIPAVVHVDGTCRPQYVTRQANERYWQLLKEVEAQTSLPLVLNTSFNLRGEPLVQSPIDAVRTFFASGLDALVLEDYILMKR